MLVSIFLRIVVSLLLVILAISVSVVSGLLWFTVWPGIFKKHPLDLGSYYTCLVDVWEP